ncbi:MAG: MarR family winged helix-turn-helix transcriptional regulator [Sedimenticola sp.]|nr:MarR family winged helix-turn-helix transcriptional regulator [Sedimenticola sp.]
MEKRKQTEVRLMVLLGIVRQLITTREAKLFAGLELNPSQFGVLNHFTHSPEQTWTVTSLAKVMEMNQPGITKIVTVLLDKGLLESRADAADGRRRYLKITAQGLTLCKSIIKSLMPDVSYIFEDWEDVDLTKLEEKMEKLMHWLDTHRDDIKLC